MSNKKFLRLPEVIEMTGFSRATLYRWCANGKFPKFVKPTPKSTVWVASEVEAWIDSKIEARGVQ